MQVTCQRNFNVILTRKEGETLTEQEIRDIGIRCALRHMDSLRMQAKEEKKADFTEPCKNCPDIESCNCDCSTTTKKIADEAGYNTDLVGGTINLYRMKSMEVIVNENEKGMSLDIKTKCPVKLREPGRLIRGIYKARLKVAKKIIRKEKEKAKKENKEILKENNQFQEDKEVLEFRKEYEKSMKQPMTTKRDPKTLPKSQRGRRRKTQ